MEWDCHYHPYGTKYPLLLFYFLVRCRFWQGDWHTMLHFQACLASPSWVPQGKKLQLMPGAPWSTTLLCFIYNAAVLPALDRGTTTTIWWLKGLRLGKLLWPAQQRMLFSHHLKLLEAKIKIKTKPVTLPTHWDIFQWPATWRYEKHQTEEHNVRRQMRSIWSEAKCGQPRECCHRLTN